MHCIYNVRSLYFRIITTASSITFLSPEIATSINKHVPFSLPQIMMSGSLMGMVLLACTCWFWNDLYLLILVHSSLSILSLLNDDDDNNQCYNEYLPLWIVSNWLLKNCVQELGSWTEEWEELHDIKTILWLQICAPLMCMNFCLQFLKNVAPYMYSNIMK